MVKSPIFEFEGQTSPFGGQLFKFNNSVGFKQPERARLSKYSFNIEQINYQSQFPGRKRKPSREQEQARSKSPLAKHRKLSNIEALDQVNYQRKPSRKQKRSRYTLPRASHQNVPNIKALDQMMHNLSFQNKPSKMYDYHHTITGGPVSRFKQSVVDKQMEQARTNKYSFNIETAYDPRACSIPIGKPSSEKTQHTLQQKRSRNILPRASHQNVSSIKALDQMMHNLSFQNNPSKINDYQSKRRPAIVFSPGTIRNPYI